MSEEIRDYNNFYMHFPEGTYRKNIWEEQREGDEKLQADLDEVLSEIDFDLKRHSSLHRRNFVLIDQIREIFMKSREENRDLTQEDQKKLNRITLLNEKILGKILELERVPYEKMRERGYSHRDLIA